MAASLHMAAILTAPSIHQKQMGTGAAGIQRDGGMLRRGLVAIAVSALLVGSAWSASVEVRPAGTHRGQTVYALALVGDIQAGDDLDVASLLGEALVEARFPGFMVLLSNGGNTNASLGIARIAHEYGLPVLVRGKCLSGCAVIALSAWRGRLFVVGSGVIGLHQSWAGVDYAHAVPSLEGTRKAARALRSYGVPGWVVERMMRTPPRRMTYLSDAELRQIGAVVKRRP